MVRLLAPDEWNRPSGANLGQLPINYIRNPGYSKIQWAYTQETTACVRSACRCRTRPGSIAVASLKARVGGALVHSFFPQRLQNGVRGHPPLNVDMWGALPKVGLT